MVVTIPTEQRRLRAVHRLQAVQRSAVLDAVCEIGVLGTGADFAFCTLIDDESHRVVGRARTEVTAYPRLPGPVLRSQRLLLVGDMTGNPETAVHPMVDGRLERMRAGAVAALYHSGEAVGMVGLGWRQPVPVFAEEVATVLRRMVPVAETIVQSEAALMRMAQEAFLHLERVRG